MMVMMIRFKRLPENIMERIESLPEFLDKEEDVVFAYLFGGLLKEKISPLSDIDIAIYTKNRKKFDYMEFYCRLTEFLGTEEVDLIVLNDAPISLLGRILTDRRVIIDKEPFLRHKFESLNLRKYYDFSVKERDILKRRYGIG